MRAIVLYLVAGAVLVLNPFVACDGGFEFGTHEVEAALAGNWTATWSAPDGTAKTQTFKAVIAKAEKHASRGFIASAQACGHRTLVPSAEACKDSTDVELRFIALADPAQVMKGALHISGTKFEHGDLQVTLDGVTLHGTISKTGALSGVSASGGTAKLAHAH